MLDGPLEVGPSAIRRTHCRPISFPACRRGRVPGDRPLGNADEQDAATRNDRLERVVQRGFVAGALEGDVDGDRIAGGRNGRIDQHHAASAGRPRGLHPVRQDVRRNNDVDSGGAQGPDQDQPDRTRAIDAGAGARSDVREVDRVEGDPEDLQQWALPIGEPVRDRHTAIGRPCEEPLEAAIDEIETGEPDVRAEVGPAGGAGRAGVARDSRVDGDARAVQLPADHDRGDLVTEDQRPPQPGAADPALEELVAVRPAETDRRHPQQDLAVADGRHRLAAHAHVAGGVEARGPIGPAGHATSVPIGAAIGGSGRGLVLGRARRVADLDRVVDGVLAPLEPAAVVHGDPRPALSVA